MFSEYIAAALERAIYKTIDSEDHILFLSLSSPARGLQARQLKRPEGSLLRSLKNGYFWESG
jgi:hypothetical protein